MVNFSRLRMWFNDEAGASANLLFNRRLFNSDDNSCRAVCLALAYP